MESKRSTAKTSPAKKAKAPSKSSRTVTGIALDQFRQPREQDDQGGSARRDYRVLLSGDMHAGKNPNSKRKKAEPAKRKLLEPELAMRRMEKLDLLFGTSSQLIGEESPEYLRALQQALQESEAAAPEDSGGAPCKDSAREMPEAKSRSLWSVGARGDEEMLLFEPGSAKRLCREEPTGFLPASPHNAPLCQDKSIAIPAAHPRSPHADEDFADIDAIQATNEVASPQPASRLRTNSRIKPKLLCLNHTQTAATAQPTRAILDPLPINSPLANAGAARQLYSTEASSVPTKPRPQGGPRKSVPREPTGPSLLPAGTPEQLAAANRRQANRRRSYAVAADLLAMIPQVMSGGAPNATGTNDAGNGATNAQGEDHPAEPAKPAKPTKRKHKAKDKADSAATAGLDDLKAADEISDSDLEPPSSPRRNLKKSKPAAGGADPKEHRRRQYVHDDLTTARALLFPKITQAVRGQPRPPAAAADDDADAERNPQRLTWHEKMLLYDPIVVEDLCAWLNGGEGGARGALAGVGWEGWPVIEEYQSLLADGNDDELKEGETGRKRRRKEGTKTAAKEEERRARTRREVERQRAEVRPAAVQRWCEDLGVCCLWREGPRGGVKARY